MEFNEQDLKDIHDAIDVWLDEYSWIRYNNKNDEDKVARMEALQKRLS